MAFVNIANWSPDQVADWLRGLDDVVLPYVHFFLNSRINGKRLLTLTHQDLFKLNIHKLGHQELILEAVDLLSALHFRLDSQNLQSLALHVGCQARSLHNEIKAHGNTQLSIINANEQSVRLPITVLASVTHVVMAIKSIVSWLNMPPFDHNEYSQTKNSLVQLGMELTTTAQNDNTSQCRQVIMKNCLLLSEMCDDLMRCTNDPLVIQPAMLEIATIRKKPDEELGMHLQSSYNGTHLIGGVKEDSPAEMCGKIEEGDEVIQVNYQTVIGWTLKKLVEVLRENQKEVTLTLKKRPRHASLFGPQVKKKKKAVLKTTTFPKLLRDRSRESVKTRSPIPEFLDISTPPVSAPIATEDTVLEQEHENGQDTDSEVFRSGSESPNYSQVEGKQRRATVSGASPTLKRPSFKISDLTQQGRPKSDIFSSPSSDGSVIGSPGSDDVDGKIVETLTVNDMEIARNLLHLSPSFSKKIELNVPGGSPKTSPKRRRGTETASKEIADHCQRSQPQLMKLTRIDSERRGEIEKERLGATVSPLLFNSYAQDKENRSIPEENVHTGNLGPGYDTLLLRLIPGDLLSAFPRRQFHTLPVLLDSPAALSNSYPNTLRAMQGDSLYQVNVVGGVVQKTPIKPDMRERQADQDNGQVVVLRRPRRGILPSRIISCKDLGKGDCQGWLYREREARSIVQSKWYKCWCVLKDQTLYVYKSRDDLRSKAVLNIIGFRASPASEIKSKKYTFKLHKSDKSFLFAVDEQADRTKWLNKLGLAAVNYDTSNIETTAGFSSPVRRGQQNTNTNVTPSSESDETVSISPSVKDFSESDNSDSESETPSTGGSPQTSSPEHSVQISRQEAIDEEKDDPELTSPVQLRDHGSIDHALRKTFISIRQANLSIDGTDIKQRRISKLAKVEHLCRPPSLAAIRQDHARHSQDLDNARKLSSLQRTLKAKQLDLDVIERLLSSEHISPETLREFKLNYPHLCSISERYMETDI